MRSLQTYSIVVLVTRKRCGDRIPRRTFTRGNDARDPCGIPLDREDARVAGSMTTEPMNDAVLIGLALEEARLAPAHGDTPIGAVMIDGTGTVVARNHNRREEHSDPTAHAEMLVIREAARQNGSWRLEDHTLAVTLEPCAMCAGALVNARLRRLVYGAPDLKAGAAWSLFNIPQDRRLNHAVDMTAGVLADECGDLLRSFFAERR